MIAAAVDCQWAWIDDLLPPQGPDPQAGLSPAERQELDRFRDAGRRRTWLAGRVLAKRLVQARLGDGPPAATLPAAQIEILSRNAAGQAVRPVIRIDGRPCDWSLSIAHTDRAAAAALAVEPGTAVGVDLVAWIPGAGPGAGFLETWFTADERAGLDSRDAGENGDRHHLPERPAGCCAQMVPVTFLPEQLYARWALKEALYKAVNAGEPFRPRQVEVRAQGDDFALAYQGRPVPAQAALRRDPAAAQILALVTVSAAAGPPARGAVPAACAGTVPLGAQRAASAT